MITLTERKQYFLLIIYIIELLFILLIYIFSIDRKFHSSRRRNDSSPVISVLLVRGYSAPTISQLAKGSRKPFSNFVQSIVLRKVNLPSRTLKHDGFYFVFFYFK